MLHIISLKVGKTQISIIKTTRRIDFEDLVEFARLFSSEIEYSQDNFEKVMEKL